ncbi:manganese efflux pump MntP family protein [Virgibacillus halophilus]|uniref:Putative manganese efflux pump MntP n=1 Tax=Tigheibacillus halophilus TaxID=361280 RepID=A0ABU5C4I5_9BACI|nr:manganese efflux pump MntP family protein [Virgibacillus halophilus]
MFAGLYQEFFTLVCIALALGMDAFSVSLGLGMKKLRLKRILMIGIVVGGFHVVMPLIGILTGKLISNSIGDWAAAASGFLLFGIGAHMIFSAFNFQSRQVFHTAGIGLIFFAFSVSLDSFSLGLSIGMSEIKIIMSVIVFGTVSAILTWGGLLLGRKVQGMFGAYSEIMGGSVLCGFGLLQVFGI